MEFVLMWTYVASSIDVMYTVIVMQCNLNVKGAVIETLYRHWGIWCMGLAPFPSYSGVGVLGSGASALTVFTARCCAECGCARL